MLYEQESDPSEFENNVHRHFLLCWALNVIASCKCREKWEYPDIDDQ